MTRAIAVLAIGCALAWPARLQSDKPIAMVVASGPARLLRTGTSLEIDLRRGDMLFAGDKVTVDSGESLIWYCPAAQAIHLAAGAGIQFEEHRVAPLAGPAPVSDPIPFCPVPDATRAELERPAFVAREVSRSRVSDAPPPEDPATLPPTARAALEAELQRIESAAVPDPDLRLAARAAAFARYGLHAAAAEAFNALAAHWSRVDWPRQLVHEQHEQLSRGEAAGPAIGGGGQTFALLIGISDYPLLRPDQRLQFADRDADLLYTYLRSPRGGALPDENIRLLRNQDATVSAIRNNIADFLRARASHNDTVLILIAAHGVSGPDGAFIIAYDSDPDNLPDTGINMLEIQDLLEGGLQQVGHVLIFVDVCHAGLIGNIQTKNFSRALQILGRFKGEETFGLLASAPDEKSVEAERFGGGHGAFSYFLSRALNGDADEDGDRRITVNELQAYVYNMVRRSTRNKQNPRPTGDMPGERVLISDVSRAGIEIAGWQELPATVVAAQARDIPPAPQLPARLSAVTPELQDFRRALDAGSLLPPENPNAFDILARLRATRAANPLELLLLENALRTALEDRAQEVLLKYLRGEEAPQTRQDFQSGALWFQAALALDPEALAWQSRAWFCEARTMLFESRFPEAMELLERAVRLEPEGPYLYNALGLLYLQQAAFPKAAAAFQDAIRLAPYWSYPRHNLALTLVQTGSYDRAIAVYRDAQRIAPRAWFIAYNQGLVEQRIQRLSAAEKLFRIAAAMAPARPEPETAMGYIAALRGRTADAEKHYRDALQKQPSFLPASHDLALLLSDSGRPAEAIALWRSVLRQEPTFTASRMALAAALERDGHNPEALAEYFEATRLDPQLTGAELAAGRLLLSLKRTADAEAIARRLVDNQPSNAAAWELLGDLLAARANLPEAADAYQRAAASSGGEQKRALERKRKRLGKARP